MVHLPSPSSDSDHQVPTVLARGAACLNCRRRKVRCNGAKPVCGTCARGPIGGEPGPVICEYGPERGTRIDSSRPMKPLPKRILRHPPPIPIEGDTGHHVPETVQESGPFTEPSLFIRLTLLHYFLHTFSHHPVFLDVARFRQAVLLPFAHTHQARPHPALLASFYLWGTRIAASREAHFAPLVPDLLERALAWAPLHPSSDDSFKPVELIQAHVLMAQYFFIADVDVELGRAHLERAISLVHRCRLHRRDPSTSSSSTSSTSALALANASTSNVDTVYGPAIELGPTADPIERMERSGAFWAVLTCHNCWATAWGLPVLWKTTLVADVAWPSEADGVVVGGGTSTTSAMVKHGMDRCSETDRSQITLYIKASMVFERAIRLFSEVEAPERLSGSFNRLCLLTNDLLGSMPSFSRCRQMASASGCHKHSQELYVITPCLVFTAAIVLHAPFIESDPDARKLCFRSACQVLLYASLLREDVGTFIPCLLWVLLGRTCRALRDEIQMQVKGAMPMVMPECAYADIITVTTVWEKGMEMLKIQAEAGCTVATYQYTQHCIRDW